MRPINGAATSSGFDAARFIGNLLIAIILGMEFLSGIFFTKKILKNH